MFQQQPQPQNQQQRPRRGFSMGKMILVAFLAGFAMFLQVTVWTLEVLLEERQAMLKQRRRGGKDAAARSSGIKATTDTDQEDTATAPIKSTSSSASHTHPSKATFTTIRSSETTDAASIHTHRTAHPPPLGSAATTAAAAYWNLAVEEWLSRWDPNAVVRIAPQTNATLPTGYYDSKRATRDNGDTGYNFPTVFEALSLQSSSSSSSSDDDQEEAAKAARVIDALVQAARQGHATAQFHVANAYAAGFWPMEGAASSSLSSSLSLTIQETWTVPTSHQQQEALLFWRMAAMNGHVESAMAVAHRLETSVFLPGGSNNNNNQQSSNSNNNLNKKQKKALAASTCQAALPYWEAAASGIMDQLEADSNSRVKVIPATDKHELHVIHLHGGTNSQLEHYNKADESLDALQFYHLRAVNMHGTDQAAQAAFTLAQYYHHGLRGVTQNVTLAAEYYVMAAEQNHWEAAGQVGKLYLWGIGVPHDPYEAQRYFNMGVPAGLYDCQSRFQRLTKQSKKKDSSISLCEANCLNGLGLIRVLGLPHVTAISIADAEAFFELARDQGNGEAAYNLAMLRLGWKQHWKRYDQVKTGGTTTIEDQFFNKDTPVNHPSHTEYQNILSDLRIAASRGHIQANFRLGLFYSEGVSIPKASSGGKSSSLEDQKNTLQVIPQDCEKATKHFKWIVDSVSPDRARRMRHAYQQYVAGDTANALRNYLAAAATGSETAQLNAAFLLERGECPGLSTSVDCAKAAVRLWKAAAEKGQGEACLRVGDFYYYGRLRPTRQPVGPFGWTRYLVFPEEFVPTATQWFEDAAQGIAGLLGSGSSGEDEEETGEAVCTEEEGPDGTCSASESTHPTDESEHSLEGDLEMAAHYYQLAASAKDNARANFNLGFLYEWGYGLKQDFPLAKRHYDLAKSAHTRDPDLPVVIALFTLSVHERIVKLWMSCERWMILQGWFGEEAKSTLSFPSPGPSSQEGTPQPSKRDKMDVIMAHIFAWDSLLILILTVLFITLLRCGRGGTR